MPKINGLNFGRILKPMLSNTDIFVTSEQIKEQPISELRALGVVQIMAEPFSQKELVASLQEAIDTSK